MLCFCPVTARFGLTFFDYERKNNTQNRRWKSLTHQQIRDKMIKNQKIIKAITETQIPEYGRVCVVRASVWACELCTQQVCNGIAWILATIEEKKEESAQMRFRLFSSILMVSERKLIGMCVMLLLFSFQFQNRTHIFENVPCGKRYECKAWTTFYFAVCLCAKYTNCENKRVARIQRMSDRKNKNRILRKLHVYGMQQRLMFYHITST